LLTRQKRKIATTPARSETTGAVARKFRLSDGRVSQLRRELEEFWLEFQREAGA
jgi:hypothetical protein